MRRLVTALFLFLLAIPVLSQSPSALFHPRDLGGIDTETTTVEAVDRFEIWVDADNAQTTTTTPSYVFGFGGTHTVKFTITTLLGALGLGGGSQGDLFYLSAASTVSRLAKSATATRYLSNTGTTNNPAWAQVALATGVSGTLPMANGGLAADVSAFGGIVRINAGTASALTPTNGLEISGSNLQLTSAYQAGSSYDSRFVLKTQAVNTNTPLSGGGALSANLTLSIDQVDTDTSGYLSFADYNTLMAKVDAYIFNAPLVETAGEVDITQASTSTSGYLSDTDWDTFNNKEPAIAAGTTLQYRRGDESWQTLNTLAVPELTNLYYTDARARASLSATTPVSYNSGTGAITLTTVAIAKGGTGQTAQDEAYDALSPNTTLGDVSYRGASDNVRLAGNITTTRKFLSQTGDGVASAAPEWDTIDAADLPTALVLTGDLTVDNINLSGNTISSTGGTPLTLTSAAGLFLNPAAGSAVTTTQGTPGTIIQTLVTTATNDDPKISTIQNRIAVTDATPTVVHSFTTTTDNCHRLHAIVMARRTGGTSGSDGDCALYDIEGLFKNIAGTVTQVGSTILPTNAPAESQAGWACDFDISTTSVRVLFTGAADNNVTVHLLKLETSSLGS